MRVDQLRQIWRASRLVLSVVRRDEQDNRMPVDLVLAGMS